MTSTPWEVVTRDGPSGAGLVRLCGGVGSPTERRRCWAGCGATLGVRGRVSQAEPCRTGAAEFRVLPGGRIRITNMVVRDLIGFVYEFNVLGLKVEGGPSWIHCDRFDIEAIGDAEQEAAETPESGPPAATPAPSPRPVDPRRRTRCAAMLRTLMEQRFKLRAHRATVERDMYALVLAAPDGTLCPGCGDPLPRARRGPAKKPAVVDWPDDCGTRTSFRWRDCRTRHTARGPGLNAQQAPWGRPPGRRPDRAERVFRLYCGAGPGRRCVPIEQGARLMTAFEDQLGLKLEAIRGTQELIVIDRVEHPAPNP